MDASTRTEHDPITTRPGDCFHDTRPPSGHAQSVIYFHSVTITLPEHDQSSPRRPLVRRIVTGLTTAGALAAALLLTPVAPAAHADTPPPGQPYGNSGSSQSTVRPGGNPECRQGDPLWCEIDGGFITIRFYEPGTYEFEFTMSDADGRGTYTTRHTVSNNGHSGPVTIQVVSPYFREMGFKIDKFSYRW
ncbi:hypothetical protein Ae717Ps2_6985c [Pseudonocardia sp. Ae717_Ps2]|nr:hypothetical protein Ae717Ps2_6985c [Pseudonocardia sp. Ae717_Ps2]